MVAFFGTIGNSNTSCRQVATPVADGPILKNSISIFFTVFIDLWYNQFKRLNKGDYPGRKC